MKDSADSRLFCTVEDLKQEYSNLNIEEPLRLLENTDSEIFLQIQKIQEEFSENKSEMKDHVDSIHKRIKNYQCRICDKKMATGGHFRKHTKQHVFGSTIFTCDVCEKGYTCLTNMKDHFSKIHDRISNNVKCDICGKGLTASALKGHKEAVHNQKIATKCNFCGTTFKYKSNLLPHIRNVHEKIKTFKCKMCELQFSREYHLKRHFERNHHNN